MLLVVCSLSVCAQKIPTAPPDKKVTIADEVELVKSGDKKFRVIISNELTAQKIEAKYRPTILLSYNGYKRQVKYKGKPTIYWEYSYYFNNEDYNTVMAFIQSGYK